MPSSRLSLRLGQLPHDVLAELAARLCSDSPALQATAEECMAAHAAPLSHELVERVLLSPDLVPSILGPLDAKDWAAAAVCSQWLVGWKATNETPWRRRLKQVPLDLPEEIGISIWDLEMAATPDGRLLVHHGHTVHILDRSMRALQTVATHDDLIAANDEAIFMCCRTTSVRRSTYDGTTVAKFELEGYQLAYGALSPGSLLFSVIWNGEDDQQDEIVALDAQTLQLRHRFGLRLLNGAQHLAVAGDELYVCDNNNDRLQVFSFTGEHRRSLTGAWRRPWYLCSAKDRLYLIEEEYVRDEEEDEDDDPAAPLQGRRILVLSLQGDVLQVVTHPSEPAVIFSSICCFDDKLLAGQRYIQAGRHAIAFQGL